MRICHCTLPYLNPSACQKCSNNTEVTLFDTVTSSTSKRQDAGISPNEAGLVIHDNEGNKFKLKIEKLT